jgi:hypothetical protein
MTDYPTMRMQTMTAMAFLMSWNRESNRLDSNTDN